MYLIVSMYDGAVIKVEKPTDADLDDNENVIINLANNTVWGGDKWADVKDGIYNDEGDFHYAP